jgi:hypothetical protein
MTPISMTTGPVMLNCTPHPINVYRRGQFIIDEKTRKNILIDGEKPILVIEPSGTVLGVKFAKTTENIFGIPFSSSSIENIDTVDNDTYHDTDFIIVSKIYKDARPNDHKFITVDSVIFDSNGKPCGCAGFYL